MQVSLDNRPGNLVETIVIDTVSFPQSVNGGNNNLFLQHLFLEHTNFWTIPAEKMTQEDLYSRITIFFRTLTLRLWSSVQSVIFRAFVLCSFYYWQPIGQLLSLTSHTRKHRYYKFIFIFLQFSFQYNDIKHGYSSILKCWKT